MATNKVALIRYKTIDDCLKNRFRKWTLEDLMEKVSDALYEYEGITSGVSKRTIQGDLQMMRSDKLGYNAPIVIVDRKFYCYETADFSITNSPINASDMEKMKEIVSVLKHLNGFQYFDEMSEMIAKLENNIQKSGDKKKNYIQFESNAQLKGLGHINPIYQAILKRIPLLIEYKSFKALQSHTKIYYPYLLKEYRNRWFLLALPKKGSALVTMALDRIIEFQEIPKETFIEYQGVDFERYFGDLLGVTKTERDRACKVVLEFDSSHAPYILTKPIHQSQQILKQDVASTIIRLDVCLNFELEREILGFADFVKVLGPRHLAQRIKRRLEKAASAYSETARIKA
ncbi:helix-turn-helix transcriptional regulator [Flavobacterium silvaticum]|uniref:WYL domain-containing protein n=1 Tax=Flavobacterium silvaticum TaxID=1852020 RepID=A0A972G2J2_9FLAO|nr:WYL domain-containing protein [Flavobacterium silvaticum]NMH29286.1 WYL domain-containing protein [Flavobacterium silvaticum]